MKTLILSALLTFTAFPALAQEMEPDCRRGQILLNLNEETDREGFIRFHQLLATTPLLESVKLMPTPFDPNTGSRTPSRVIVYSLFDAFPNATPEWKEDVRQKLTSLAVELREIPGVVVQCGSIPVGPAPRISGAF